MKHIQGPWENFHGVIRKGDTVIATVWSKHLRSDSVEVVVAEANAALIAVVPDLLEALKPFAEKCPDDDRLAGKRDHPVTITVRLKHLRQARAALERAKVNEGGNDD